MAHRNRRRYVLSYALTIVLLAVAAHYISGHGERFRQLLSVALGWLPVLGMVLISSLALRAWFLKQLARELGARVSARECFCLFGATQMFEVLTLPATGIAYRAVHVHRVWGVPLVSYAAGMAVFALARLAVWGLPAIACLVWIALSGGDVRRSVVFLLLACLLALTVAWAGQRALRRIASQRTSRFARLAEGCLRVTSSRRVGTSAVVAMLGCAAAQAAGFYVIFRSSGLPVGAIESIVITASHQLSGLVALTPGGLGIQEAASLLFSTVLGVAVADMLIVLALMRVGRMLLAVAVGGPCWWLLPAGNRDIGTRRPIESHPETVR